VRIIRKHSTDQNEKNISLVKNTRNILNPRGVVLDVLAFLSTCLSRIQNSSIPSVEYRINRLLFYSFPFDAFVETLVVLKLLLTIVGLQSRDLKA